MKPFDSHSHGISTLVEDARSGPSKDIVALDELTYACLPATQTCVQSSGVGVGLASDTNVSRTAKPHDVSLSHSSATVVALPRVERVFEPPNLNDGRALFEGFFLGGFECSCHRLQDGRRLDVTTTSRHDEFANADYARLRQMGMTACRDGVSWVRAERVPGQFDFSFAMPMLDAARHQSITVIWDLMHFGWPDDVDVFSPVFPSRFSRYAGAFAKWLRNETDMPTLVAPINEMSYLAWAGGDVRCMNPFQSARGVELKVQLVRATLEAIEAIRCVLPNARFLQPEPVINIVPHPDHPKTWRRVESDNLLQYQAWEMLRGDIWPNIGGHPRFLDIIGVNFYSDNQFMLDGTTVLRGDRRYRSFSSMLLEVWHRYKRPMIVSETGHEGTARAEWLHYISDECERAMQQGCELHGITLYPVVSTLGWGDDRRCDNGLWGDADETGQRPICDELAREILVQTPRLQAARARVLQPRVTAKAPIESL